MAPHFFPAMWEQRRICIARTLYAHEGISRVLEVGCGEGNVLSFLATEHPDSPIAGLYGIDINAESLFETTGRLQPNSLDKRDLRVHGLRVELYQGNGMVPVPSLMGSVDAVVCTEVIEHVSEDLEVPRLTRAILGNYQPRLAIFTTPNAEFNANFPDLKYGAADAKFRDDDHKFEWTRQQFDQWAQSGAQEYGYTVEIRHIGKTMRNPSDDFVSDCGGCTQMAVFTRVPALPMSALPADPTKDPTSAPKLFAAMDYPVYDKPPLGKDALGKFMDDTVAMVNGISVDTLWSLLEVRQQFKHRSALQSWMSKRK